MPNHRGSVIATRNPYWLLRDERWSGCIESLPQPFMRVSQPPPRSCRQPFMRVSHRVDRLDVQKRVIDKIMAFQCTVRVAQSHQSDCGAGAANGARPPHERFAVRIGTRRGRLGGIRDDLSQRSLNLVTWHRGQPGKELGELPGARFAAQPAKQIYVVDRIARQDARRVNALGIGAATPAASGERPRQTRAQRTKNVRPVWQGMRRHRHQLVRQALINLAPSRTRGVVRREKQADAQ